MVSIWVNQRKRKEEINLSKSSPQDPKPEREERLFSMQLISQEKNPTTEINHFEGNRPEWLVPRGTHFLLLAESRILRWREGNNLLVHACRTNSLFFILFFHFSSYLSFFFFLSCYSSFLFPNFPVFNPLLFLPSLLLLYTARASFYSACYDWILLF